MSIDTGSPWEVGSESTWEVLMEEGLRLTDILHFCSRDILPLAEVRNSYLVWSKKIRESFQLNKVSASLLSKLEEPNSDYGNIFRGRSAIGRPLSEDQLLESLQLEFKRKMSLLREAHTLMNKSEGLSLVPSKGEFVAVTYNGKQAKIPFSKKEQHVRVLEYIVMQPREKNGISTVIQKSAVWEDLVEYNKKSPFLTVPKKKKDEDMRKSVDRHLEAIENKLKNCFPEIQKDVIFQSVDNGGFIRMI